MFEYCNGGNLVDYMKSRKILSETETINIFKQLLNAFKELDRNNVIHRDLKPDNIMLSNGVIKLGDFGFCC